MEWRKGECGGLGRKEGLYALVWEVVFGVGGVEGSLRGVRRHWARVVEKGE